MDDITESIEGDSAESVLSHVISTLSDAERSVDHVVGQVVDDVRGAADAAERSYELVLDEITGSLLSESGRLEKPVEKLLTDAERSAWETYGRALDGLYRQGMSPLSQISMIMEDMGRDDPRQSAIDMIIGASPTAIIDVGPAIDPKPPGPTEPVPGPAPSPAPGPMPAPAPSPGPMPGPVPQGCIPYRPGMTYELDFLPLACYLAAPDGSPPFPIPTLWGWSCRLSGQTGRCLIYDVIGGPVTPPPAACPAPVVACPAPIVNVLPPPPAAAPLPEEEWRPLPPASVPRVAPRDGGWDSPDQCRSLDPTPLITPEEAEREADRIYGPKIEQARQFDEEFRAGIVAQFGGTVPDWLTGMLSAEKVAVSERARFVSEMSAPGRSLSRTAVRAMAAIAAARWNEEATKAPTSYLAEGQRYNLQFADPQYLPSQEVVDELYLTRTITEELWECLTRANGNKVWARKLVIRSRRQRPNLTQWISLFRKGRIDEEQLWKRAQESGITDITDLEALLSDSVFVPPYTDLVRMMVRDAADKTIVDKYEYDTGFGDKYKGPLKEWAKAQGIPDDAMRYIWRSHWQLPSPTQLYEMVRRLRPGRVPAEAAIEIGDVRQALLANDIAPTFVERLIAVSYNTVTRTDLLTFYSNGSMDKPEIIERLQDTGYNRADSVRIADAWELEVANRQANRSRVWSRSNITKRYINGTLDRATAEQLLSRTIPLAEEVQRILNDCDAMRTAQRREKCLKAVRKRRIQGELDTIGSAVALQDLGVDPQVAVTIAEGWECEVVSMSKEPAVAMLKDWLVRGFIDVAEAYRRLLNLRYKPADAEMILADLLADEQERRAALAAKAAAAALARAEKEEKERRAAARRTIQNRERIAKGKEPLP